MNAEEAREAIIKEIEMINFCGHCLEMNCKTCEKEKTRKNALQKLDQTTENDYIAEYVKENHPGMVKSAHFILWKLLRKLKYTEGEE